MGTRIKTFDSTGTAPNGRLYAGDLNAMQDQYADRLNLAQTISFGLAQIGETGLQLLRFGAGEARLSGSLRTDGIIRGLGGFIAGAFTTAQRNAITLPPYGLRILNTDNNREEWNSGTAGSPNWQPVGATPSTRGLLAAIGSGSSVAAGTFYYATDQDVLYQSNGTTWVRIGPGHQGDLYFTLNAAADPGRILCQGQAWPSTTGIYSDLFAKWGGSNLPDLRGRMPVVTGTHPDVNAIRNNENVGVGARRPVHKHGVASLVINIIDPGHFHTVPISLTSGGPGSGGNLISGGGPMSTSVVSTGITATPGGVVGPNSGSEPLESPAYYVVQVEAKL